MSGVAAFGSQDLGFRTSVFGSQDLGFRTSIFGSQDLGFRTSINGHSSLLLLLPPCFYNASVAAFGSQDLGFRTSLVCVSSPPRPAAPKCNRGRFCHRKCRDRFCHRIVVSDRIVLAWRNTHRPFPRSKCALCAFPRVHFARGCVQNARSTNPSLYLKHLSPTLAYP
jgi:hypothetical protein